MNRQPYEVEFAQIQQEPEPFIDAVFESLTSEFLLMPKGEGFVEYEVFEDGYQRLKKATSTFTDFDTDSVTAVLLKHPVTFLVLRTILGFTSPEWAYIASERTGVEISQGAVRAIERKIKLSSASPLNSGTTTAERIRLLTAAACDLIVEGPPEPLAGTLHRLDKADTKEGEASVRSASQIGVPYAMLLYERYLGRPFATHRDSVSELVGDILESAIEDALSKAGVSFQKTKRAERVPGFDQAPDFMIPDVFNPKVVIEAKQAEDDGTARDKVTRIQHLGELSEAGQPQGQRKFEVIACLAGRGFKVRREDMRKILLTTHGKVFTLSTLKNLVNHTRLSEFAA